MHFNDYIDQLKELQQLRVSKIEEIDNQKKKELEQIEKQLQEKYATLKEKQQNKLETQNNEIEEYCKTIEEYSKFDEDDLGNVIAYLMSIFEGKQFIKQRTNYSTMEGTALAFDKDTYPVQKDVLIIVEEENKRSFYSDERFESLSLLVRENKAIILREGRPKALSFYCFNKSTFSLEQNIKLGKFNYIKKFIDQLIAFKMEHKISKIHTEDLEKLMANFILAHKEQIEENYRLRESEQEREMKEKLEKDKEKRQLQLNNILNKAKTT